MAKNKPRKMVMYGRSVVLPYRICIFKLHLYFYAEYHLKKCISKAYYLLTQISALRPGRQISAVKGIFSQ